MSECPMLKFFKNSLEAFKSYISRRQFLKIVAVFVTTLPLWRFHSQRVLAEGENGCFEIISVRPHRAHLVRPDSRTTFVVSLTNPTGVQVPAVVALESVAEKWTACVSKADRLFQKSGPADQTLWFDVEAGSTQYLVIELSSGADLIEGENGSGTGESPYRRSSCW